MNQYNSWNDQKLNRIKEMRLKIKYGESNDSSSSSIPLPPSLGKSKSSLTRSTQMKEMEGIRRVENSLKKKNFLISVVHEIMNAFSKYTTHCIMCGVPLPYPGAKPAICDKAICTYKFNSVGLGVDIGCALEEQPDLMKLLIATFYQAAQPSGKQIWAREWDLKNWQMCYPYHIASMNDTKKFDLWDAEVRCVRAWCSSVVFERCVRARSARISLSSFTYSQHS